MDSFYFTLEQSAWWLIIIFAVSAGLSWLLYSGKTSWNNQTKRVLRTLRFCSVFLILFLLLEPGLTVVNSFKENQFFPVLIDNSQSVTLSGESETELKKSIQVITQKIRDKGFNPVILTHSKKVDVSDSIRFNFQNSDITNLITSGEDLFSSKSNNHLLLISDGIFNSGVSPLYKSFRSSIISLGLGDTTIKKDLILKSVQNNSIAFKGNKFTIHADVQAIGFKGKQMQVAIKTTKGTIESKSISINDDNFLSALDFIVSAEIKGFQHYIIEIAQEKGEANFQNNTENAYIDIIDDRENILIAAKSPHPNIKAIRAALLKEQNINVEVLIPGIDEPAGKSYDLVILHNSLSSSLPELSKYIKENTSVFYIAGASSNYSEFNKENGLVEVNSMNQTDQAQAVINNEFSKFKLNTDIGTRLSTLPPVEVNFGNVKIKGGSDVLLYQQINGVQTQKPLLVFGQNKRKCAVLLTDGLWLLRMNEAQEKENSAGIDEIITKTVQYLSSKEDKRKFRIQSSQKEYFEGENVLIETEVYNDLYEKANEADIIFSLTTNQKTKKINFPYTENNTTLSINNLKPGIYKISGTAEAGRKRYDASTEFVIKERKLESLNLTADHNLLREISRKNRGTFFNKKQLSYLLSFIETLEPKIIWKSQEQHKKLIEQIWYFILIVACFTAEWIIRRYNGGY